MNESKAFHQHTLSFPHPSETALALGEQERAMGGWGPDPQGGPDPWAGTCHASPWGFPSHFTATREEKDLESRVHRFWGAARTQRYKLRG